MFDVLESDPAAAMMLLLAAQTMPAVFLRVVAAALYNGFAGSELIVGIVQIPVQPLPLTSVGASPCGRSFSDGSDSQAGSAATPSWITEVVGSSPNSFSDAVRNTVQAAAETVRGIQGVEVISSNADVDENGNLSLYKVNCKIAFVVERSGSRP